MAYQPKSYRKFIATAATATLVAGAVAPVASLAADFTDVTAKYKEAVDFVVSKGINGTSSTTFGTDAQIKRVDAAVMVAAVLGLDTEKAPAGGFTDVPERAVGAVNALKAAGITSGKTATTFDADSNITRGELAIWIQKGFKLEGTSTLAFTDVTERYAAAVKALVDNKVTSGTSATTFGVNNFAKRGDFAIFLQKADVAAKAGVVTATASATGAKKLEVKFNKAVDTTKAAITVKKGTSNVAVAKLTFAEDKKSATVELNSKLTEGTYTVNVAGLTATAITSEVKASNEKVNGVEFVSEKALTTVVGATGVNTEVVVAYKVVNQYGEDITSSAAMYDILPTPTNGFTVKSNVGGKITLEKAGAKTGDTFNLTLIEKNTALSASKTFTVADKSAVATVEVTGVYNKDGLAVNEDNKAEAFYLTVVAKDQYGTVITNAAELEAGLLVNVSGNSAGVLDGDVVTAGVQNFGTYEDAAKKKHTAIKLDLKAAGDTVFTLVSLTNGTPVQHKVTVDSGVKLDTVSIGAPTTGTVAGGDTVLLPVSITDNKGNAVTDATKVNGKVVISGSGHTGAKFVTKDGALYVELKADATATQSSLVVTLQSQTSKFDTEVVTVKATAAPKAVVGLKADVATSIYAGQKLTLEAKNFIIHDQYGREMASTDARFAGTVITATDGNTTATSKLTVAGLELTAGATKGYETVTFALAGVTGSSTDVDFRVVDRSEFTTYEVADLTNLYANGAALDYTDAYAQALKVYGVTADGKKVLIPANEYTVYETSSYLGYDAASGKLDAVADADATKTYEGTVNVVVTINATGQEFTKAVTVSEAAPTVDKVEVKKADGTVTTALDFTGAAFDKSNIATVVVTDNYGVVNAGLNTIARVTYTNVKEKDGSDIAITANGTSSAAIAGLAAGDTFDATFVIGGKSVKLAVTVK
jgi:trimeric autotransporter adhesin